MANYSLSGIKLNVFLGNQDKAKDELAKLIKTLENNTIKINVDFKDVKEQLDTITKTYEQATKTQENAVSKSQATIKKIYKSSNAEIKSMVEEQRKLLESQYGNKGKVNYTYATDQFGNSNITGAFIEIKNQAQETEKVMFGLRESVKTVGNEIQKIYTFDATGKKEILNLSQANKDLNKFNNTVSNTRKKYENEINKLINKNKELASDKGIIEFKNRLKNLDKFEFDDLQQELKELQLQFNKLKIDFQETGTLSQTSDNLFKRVGQYFTATSIYYEMSNAIRYAIENIRSLDTSLVELSKVSSITRDEFSSFVNEANKIGNELGKTSKDVIDAVTNFQRAGYALEDSKELAKSALTMVNISENMKDAGDNAAALVNILKGYKMEVSEVSKINDIYNNISNNMAVNFDTLVSGTREIAGLMNIYGNSLENTASMITSITEIMGSSGEETANALKTISMRLAGFNDQGEKDVQLVAKLNDEFQKIANMSLTDVNGRLKSTFEIVDEYSKKVKELNLSNETQSYLGELVAGKHRASYWTAMVQNFDSARKAMEYANNSLNSSIEEQEAYIRSLDGQIEILKSSLMSLSYNSVNTDWVINIVKGTNEIVKLIDKIGLANIAMATFVGYLSAKGKMGIFNSVINSMVSSITSYTTSVTGATATTIAFGTAMKALTGIGIFAGVMTGVAIFDQLNVTIEEQRQKVGKLKSGYDELVSKIENLKSIENPTEGNERQIALLERELELQEKLLAIETERLTKKQFDATYGSIQSDLDALQTSLKLYEDTQNKILESGGNASQFATLESREQDLLKYAQKANETLTSLMDVYDDLDDTQKEQADVMIKQAEAVLKLADDILGLNVNTKKQTDANNELGNSIDRLSVEALTNEVSSLSEAYDDNVEKIELLNKAVNSLAEGQTLTGDTLLLLLNAFPSLRDEVAETNGVYSISKEALLELKNQAVDTFGAMVNDQRTATNEAIANAKTRISAYQKELEQLKKLAQGQMSLYTLQNQNKANMGYGDIVGYSKNSKNSKKIIENNEAIKQKENQIKQEQAEMQKYLDLLNQIEIKEQDFEIATSTGNTKKGSNISNKKSKSKKDKDSFEKYYSQLIDETIDTILSENERLEDAIAFAQEKLANAELKGDTKQQEVLNKQILEFTKQKKEISHKMAEELRKVGNDVRIQLGNMNIKGYKNFNFANLTELDVAKITQSFDKAMVGASDTVKANIEVQKNKFQELADVVLRIYGEEIPNLQKQWWAEDTNYRQQQIDKIHEIADLEKRAYDDKVKRIQLEQMLMDDSGKEYQAKEEEKYQLLLGLKLRYEDKISQLKAQGLSQESEDVRKYVDLWTDAEEELVNMRKSMAERQREIGLKGYEERLKVLNDQKAAIKTISDLTIQMIKKEIEIKKKAFQEEIDGYQAVINKKKESLRKEKEDNDYKKELSEIEKQEEILNNKIAELSLDNSGDMNEKRLELEEELRELLEKKEELQNDKSLQNKEDLLDQELEAFEKEKQEEIDKLDEYLDKEGQLRQDALDMIKRNNKEMYEKLLEYNATYGDAMQEDIVKAWGLATDAANEFNNGQMDLLDILKDVTDEMAEQVRLQDELKNAHWTDIPLGNNTENSPSGSGSTGGSSWHDKKDKIAKQMQSNSKEWFNASDEQKKKLAQENEKLGQQIGAWKGSDGEWWIMVNGKRMKLYDSIGVRHTGIETGFVGGKALSKGSQEFMKLMRGEEFNILKAGEIVANPRQMDNVMNKVIPGMLARNSKTSELKIEGDLCSIVINGNADKDTIKLLRKETDRIANYTLDKLKGVMNLGY